MSLGNVHFGQQPRKSVINGSARASAKDFNKFYGIEGDAFRGDLTKITSRDEVMKSINVASPEVAAAYEAKRAKAAAKGAKKIAKKTKALRKKVDNITSGKTSFTGTIKNKIKNAWKFVTEKTEVAASFVKENSKKAWKYTAEKAKSAFNFVKTQAKKAYCFIKTQATKAYGFVKNHKLAAGIVGGVLVLGAIIGGIIVNKNKNSEEV